MDDILQKADELRQDARYPEALSLLEKALQGQKGTGRTDTLMALGDTSRMIGDFVSAEKSYSEAVSLAGRSRNIRLKTDAMVGLALSKKALGDWKGSLDLINPAIETYRNLKDKEGIAFSLWAKGGALRVKGDIEAAIKNFTASKNAFSALDDNNGIGYSLCGLGGTTRVSGLNKESLKHYTEANKIFSKIGDKFGMAYSYCGIGNALRMKADFKGALEYFKKASRLYGKMGDIVSFSYTLWSMGKTRMMLGRRSSARKYFFRALLNFVKTEDPRGVIYCKLGLAELSALEGKKANAKRVLKSAYADAANRGFKVEACHAKTLLSALEGKPDRKCYTELGLSLKFNSIPFNIP